METALGAQLKRHGFSEIENRVDLIIARAWNECERLGASREQIRSRIIALLERYRDEGQRTRASNGHPLHAPVPVPQGDGTGQDRNAREGHMAIARPSPTERDDEGQLRHAAKATSSVPSSSLPHRGGVGHRNGAGNGLGGFARPAAVPSRHDYQTPSRIEAQRAVAQASASAVLSLSHHTRIAGQDFADWNRLDGMAYWQRNKRHARDTIILRLACAEANSRGAPPTKAFRECLDQPTLIRIEKEAARFIDAA